MLLRFEAVIKAKAHLIPLRSRPTKLVLKRNHKCSARRPLFSTCFNFAAHLPVYDGAFPQHLCNLDKPAPDCETICQTKYKKTNSKSVYCLLLTVKLLYSLGFLPKAGVTILLVVIIFFSALAGCSNVSASLLPLLHYHRHLLF